MDSLPPMTPDSAATAEYSRPQRWNVRWYASSCLRKLDVEARLVAVERVRVLHDELAHAEEPAARARLVAILDREVVEHLRQLPVALDLARVEGHGLLVREREDELPPGAVLEVEELGDRDAVGRLPQLGRREHGHQHLLAADRVLLFADDLDDLLVHAPAEREERPDAGATWRM